MYVCARVDIVRGVHSSVCVQSSVLASTFICFIYLSLAELMAVSSGQGDDGAFPKQKAGGNNTESNSRVAQGGVSLEGW